MRARRRQAAAGLIGALLLILAVRLVWVASCTETGWSVLALQWRDGTLGWLLGDSTAVGDREPTDQADFWLPEVRRIVDADPQNARLAVGAAWVLDSPGYGFVSRHMEETDFSRAIPGCPTVPDCDAIARATSRFEPKCQRDCLAMAARATALEPTEPAWWQARAMLQRSEPVFAGQSEFREPRWLDVLDECARHDPDNALYDYLAAAHLWEAGVDYDLSGSKVFYRIVNRQKAEQARDRLRHGLGKRHVSLDEAVVPPVTEFLRRARVPVTERPTIAGNRLFTHRISIALNTLVRMNQMQANVCERDGDLAGALAHLRANQRIMDQVRQGHGLLRWEGVVVYQRVWTLIMTQEFALAHPQAIPAGELARLKKLCAEADAEYGLLATAAQRVRTRASLSPLAWLSIVGTCFGAVAPSAVAVLLAAVALSWALRRWLFPAGPEAGGKLGPVRHVLAWTLGYGLTFVLFGMAPAEVIPRAVQEWTLTAVAVLGAVAFGVWLVARTRGRKGPARWQFSIRAMLGATFVVAAVLGSLMWLGVDLSHPEQLRVPWRVPACAWFGIDPATVRRILTARFGPGADNWVMALLQWYAYGGLYLGPLAALALVAAWHRRRWKRRLRAEPSPEGASPRPAWRATLAAVAASAWAMMILLLLLYLACTPWLLGDMEAQYQQQMVYYRNPPQYWAAVRDTINALKSAPQIITQPRAEAAADAAPAPAGD